MGCENKKMTDKEKVGLALGSLPLAKAVDEKTKKKILEEKEKTACELIDELYYDATREKTASELIDELAKEAGVAKKLGKKLGNAVHSIAKENKAMRRLQRLATGSMIAVPAVTAGGLYAYNHHAKKQVEKIVADRPELQDAADRGAAQGAAAYGMPNVGAYNALKRQRNIEKLRGEKKASELIDELAKRAEINIPSEAEKEKASNIAPEDAELKDISCEVCGYNGKPDTKGFCPECGTLGGVKPSAKEHGGEPLYNPTYRYSSNIAEESARAFSE